MSTSNSTRTFKTDIVILGGGAAGLAAAAQAAEKGTKVVVLEKRHTVGGNSLMAMGFFAAESPAQKRMGIEAPRDELFKIAMDYHHWKVNPKIVRAFVDMSGDTVRWLEEKGLNVEAIAPNPRLSIRTMHRVQGSIVIKLLKKSCDKLGVKVICDASAKKLITDSMGKVTGVVASTKEGELKVSAKSVIITTGGYGANQRLLKKYWPGYSKDTIYGGFPELTGDGLQMAAEIGAATEGLGGLHFNYNLGYSFKGSRLVVDLTHRRPETVWVNNKGERYCDETVIFDMGSRGSVGDRQPGKISYTLFDEKIKKHIIKEGLAVGGGALVGLRGVPAGTKWTDLPRHLQIEADKGMVKISNSWDEIARWMGVVPRVLMATTGEYNSFCDRGHDEIFVKDPKYLLPLRTPPYYAIKYHLRFADTMGGIKVNHHMEALDHQGVPIPGFYAAGVCVGGWESDTYCYALMGSMFGFALNSGRIAAESAAKYVLEK